MLTTRTPTRSAASISRALSAISTSDPEARMTARGGPLAASASTYPPRETPLAAPDFARSINGNFWRVNTSAVGPVRCRIATFQASAASFASAGRTTSRFGTQRSAESCSIG